MAITNKTNIIGLIAIIVGGMLVMGGTMFLLVILMMPDVPSVILVPPFVQITLGLLAACAGYFLWRGHEGAKWILLFVGLALVANCVFLLFVFVTMTP